MLTFIIRVPYKEGNAEKIYDKVKEALKYNETVLPVFIDGQFSIEIPSEGNDMTMDLRLLELN